jgi:ssDNA-binding Zn-finger/Zn-ribbon topoisomerase 1
MTFSNPDKPLPRPQEFPVTCTCGAPMHLRFSARFPKSAWFYGCSRYPECKTTHGCHQATGKPLGRPADKETKSWRIQAHDAFDALWEKEKWKRADAYEWMRHRLGLSEEEAHIGMMDTATCQRLIEAVEELRKGG